LPATLNLTRQSLPPAACDAPPQFRAAPVGGDGTVIPAMQGAQQQAIAFLFQLEASFHFQDAGFFFIGAAQKCL